MEKWMTPEAVALVGRAYRLEIRAVLPLRSVVGLLTTQGRFMCKRYASDAGLLAEHLLAVGELKRALAARGVCPAPRETVDGRLAQPVGGALVTVEPWIRGRQADFRAAGERKVAVQAVARLHAARVPIPFALRHPPTLLQKLAYRLDEANRAAKGDRVPGLTRDEWLRWRETAARALRELPADAISRLTAQDRGRGIVCHRDLAPHNILVAAGSPASLIDFDLAGCDSPLYDLFQLYGHMTYSAPGEERIIGEMIEDYTRIADLSGAHVAALSALRSYPAQLLREVGDSAKAVSARAGRRAATRVRYAAAIEAKRVFGRA